MAHNLEDDDRMEAVEMEDRRKSKGRRVEFDTDSHDDSLTESDDDIENDAYQEAEYLRKPDANRGHAMRDSRGLQFRRNRSREPKLAKYVVILAVPLIALLILLIVATNVSSSPDKEATLAAPTGIAYASGFDMRNNWGSLSPYFDTGVAFPDTQGGHLWPPKCKLRQVHVLHRHAERYPTENRSKRMKTTIDKLKKANVGSGDSLGWLKDWEYSLGADLLVSRGVGSEYKSGADFWASHGQFLYPSRPENNLGIQGDNSTWATELNGLNQTKPLFRATEQERIVASAHAWAAGFFGFHGSEEDLPAQGKDFYRLLLQKEAPGFNSTLASYFSCPNALNSTYAIPGRQRTQNWINSYLKSATQRLTKMLPDVEITPADAHNMQLLCAFETAAYGTSRFCTLFTEVEWRGFEYSQDLEFFGHSGPSAPFSKATGAGWVAELLARLEKRYFTNEDGDYGVNTTITGDSEVFPLNQPIYLDMSHDSVIVSVLSALGLDFLESNLPDTRMPVPRNFVVSRLTPFAARLFVEVLDCEDSSQPQVRLVLNSRVLPLSGLYYCPTQRDGLCPLDKFTKSLKNALDNANFAKLCYSNDPLDA